MERIDKALASALVLNRLQNLKATDYRGVFEIIHELGTYVPEAQEACNYICGALLEAMHERAQVEAATVEEFLQWVADRNNQGENMDRF
jgi:hypothetical protein